MFLWKKKNVISNTNEMDNVCVPPKKKKETIGGILGAVLAALAIRAFLFEPYHIPSSSMVPTLLIGDYLFISKYPYGFSKHSFLFSLPIIPHGRLFGREPKQGDVVIFRQLQADKDYIKRVIGMPGDTVQMKEGRLYLNNILVPRDNPRLEVMNIESGTVPVVRYTETLPNGKKHDIYEVSDKMPFDHTPKIVVPQGHYFMMGDNRDNSQDSRYFGPVPFETLEGRAELIFYSNADVHSWFFQFYKWSKIMRWKRFFTRIY